MIVEFIRQGTAAGLAYGPGDIVNVRSEALASALIADGFVKKVDDKIQTPHILGQE